MFAHENKFVSSYTNCIVLAVIVATISIEIGPYFAFRHWYVKKMLVVLSLVLVFKQQFNELINGQTNKHQKSNLLFLQRHYQSQTIRLKLIKNRPKALQRD